jgi:hypothetical protein
MLSRFGLSHSLCSAGDYQPATWSTLLLLRRTHEQTVKLGGKLLQVSDSASRLRIPVRQQMNLAASLSLLLAFLLFSFVTVHPHRK